MYFTLLTWKSHKHNFSIRCFLFDVINVCGHVLQTFQAHRTVPSAKNTPDLTDSADWRCIEHGKRSCLWENVAERLSCCLVRTPVAMIVSGFTQKYVSFCQFFPFYHKFGQTFFSQKATNFVRSIDCLFLDHKNLSLHWGHKVSCTGKIT